MSIIQKNSYTLITGITSDIGYNIANNLKKNHNLIISGRDLEVMSTIKKSLNSEFDVLLWSNDLSDIDSVSSSIAVFLDNNSVNVDNFIHAAGITKISPLRLFDSKKYNEIFNINFFSSVEIIKILISKNNKKYLNNIIFISALFSKFGDKGNSLYASSKGAIDSFVKSLATEISPIKVNSVLPGALDTKMTRHLFESSSYMEAFNKKYLLGKGSCKSIADYVEFLVDKNSWITGQNLIIDGGASCH